MDEGKSCKNEISKHSEDDSSEHSEQLVNNDSETEKYLVYGVNDKPPIHVTIICALQQGLLALSGSLVVSLLVAEAVCASNNDAFKARLLSSTLFMNGVTTLAMVLFGIRMPLFQGASPEYIVPLLLMSNAGSNFCSNLSDDNQTSSSCPHSGVNASLNSSISFPGDDNMDRILFNVRAGSLMVAGLIHALLGFTGLVGFLLRFIGPLTIVPTLILIFIFISKPVIKFVEVNWPISISTIAMALILSLYLSRYKLPVPVWTPKEGLRIIRYPVHQVFSILISIIINWALCGLLTHFNVITDDCNDIGYRARTDARLDVVRNNPWFNFPYPGQYGPVSFSSAALLSFLIATFISVLDSIGDYYACAKICRVPAPPSHAVNRGILIEGVCSFFSGAVGCGHATSTNGGCLGAIGVTRVASRQVFVFTGILYIVFGIFGKFCAIFITIPYPVLGGAIVVLFGIFFGVVISNLEVTNMSSGRNIAILGVSTFIGLMIPAWARQTEHPVNTGNETFDQICGMLLGNPNLAGSLLACFLDNTVPGTKKERGIEAWQVKNEDTVELDRKLYDEGYEVYEPLLPKRLLRMSFMKYVPFLPYRGKQDDDDVCDL